MGCGVRRAAAQAAAIIVSRHTDAERRQAEEALRLVTNSWSHFNRAAVRRELRMIELKKEVNELQLANIEIQDSRRAAVNLMEDALQARQVAEALNVQLRHEIAERKRTEALMACQKEAFQMIASGALLREVLDFLARAIEGQSQERMAVAIHLLNESETTFIQTVAPSLPPSYMQATDGMLISSAAGPCCAAVSRRERVTVADVDASEEFAAFASFALPLNIQAGSSSPIVSSTGKVLGTVANYYRQARVPQPQDNLLEDIATRTAAIIIERKQAEEAQRYQSEQFETLLNQAPLGVYLIGGDFRIRQVNPIALPVFGDIPDLIGRDFDEVIHILWTKEYADEVVRMFRHTLETGEPYHIPERTEYRIDRGVTEYYEWRIDRIKLPEGGYGVVCYFRDICAQVHTCEELQKLNAELEERVVQRTEELVSSVAEREKLQEQLFQAQKMESIGVLAGGIAHDFNNILNIIQGYASVLSSNGSQNKQTSESLAIINESVQRGSALVQQLLTLARKSSTQQESVNANTVIEGLIALITHTFPKTIDLRSSLEADLPPIMADKNQVEQALLNLCVNARDAMAGGGTLTLKTQSVAGATLRALGAIPEKRYVCIEVTDSGVGMNESVQERIFEPFFTTKDRGQGTGLGLSVVYGIVKNHDGLINVESKPERGTTFGMYFQIASAADRVASDPAKNPVAESKAASNGVATVFLVEDEKNMVDLLQKVLLQRGYRVFTATDGEEALEIFLRDPKMIDVVVLDIGLPKMTGRAVLSKMKQAKPDLQVIVTSGYLERELRSEIDRMGVKHFLRKPYTPDEVVTTIQSLIEGES